LIHRDLKPDNLLLLEPVTSVTSVTRSALQVKICDFSAARALVSSTDHHHKQPQMTVGFGTLEFMAPELLSGDGAYGKAVDVYAFGILLFSMLTLADPRQALASKDGRVGGIADATAGVRDAPGAIDSSLAIAPAALMHAVCTNGLRPRLEEFPSIPASLVRIIECAWSQDEQARPSFVQIVSMLKEFDAMGTMGANLADEGAIVAENPMMQNPMLELEQSTAL
jgi:serine/threonine protein kinase